MVDFKKRMAGKNAKKPIDPLLLYDNLDRAHDKGPLRPAQISVLEEWYSKHRNDSNIIVKLHTGQGKTLVGLLMLQSLLNESEGPALYLCPNNFLIDQTCEQARQFGIQTCKSDSELPIEFLDSKCILVTSVQKLFNGLTKFGLNSKSINVSNLLMDDAHACADIIRESFSIRISRDENIYHELKTLFASDLESQGVGTYSDIQNKDRNSFLPVPYWSWIEHETEIARILSNYKNQNSIKFTWPLLKDMLIHCSCVISGDALEIRPSVPPLEAFGSYWNAKYRIFMSATVTDDSFLVKGLRLSPNTIINPLTYSKENWSGEKMILLPSLIHEDLDRERIVKYFGSSNKKKKFGVVALTSSFARTKDWEAYGAIVATTDTLYSIIQNLSAQEYEQTVVLANRYDGIDLPDDTCRILIFDSKPHSQSLIDLHEEMCRPESEAILMRTIRTIEQGMGRSVRGEKDYSVIVVTGSEITRLVRDKHSRNFLSPQMSIQVGIGIDIVALTNEELEEGEKPIKVFTNLLKQSLNRDEDWKAYYVQEMDSVKPSMARRNVLKAYSIELDAENLYRNGDYGSATKKIQKYLDNSELSPSEKGWYLQEMARYNYIANRSESQNFQKNAHKTNRLLLKPRIGITVKKLTVISQKRMERITSWVSNYDDYDHMDLALADILGSFVFGTKSDKFERALFELGSSLGFGSERPDKEWKEGPDNLWVLDDKQHIIWECKSEVKPNRAEINKHETEQMNSSSDWFEKIYKTKNVKRVIIHPSHKVSKSGAFRYEVEVMREKELNRFVKVIREFFKEFEKLNFMDLSTSHIQELVTTHKLSVSDFLTNFSIKAKHLQ